MVKDGKEGVNLEKKSGKPKGRPLDGIK